MLQKLLLGLFMLCLPPLYSQNLIKNGGFEKYERCPYDLGKLDCEGWRNSSKGTSPDLFSYCAHKTSKSHPNWVGIKPASGKCFAGIVVYAHKIDYRESITNEFTEPMEAGKTYTVTFKVGIPYICRWKNDNIHLYFTEKPLFQIGDEFVNKEKPILFSIKDAPIDGGWKTYTYQYTAKGGEKYLSFGNYNNHKETKVSIIDSHDSKLHKKEYNHSYIAIDDVSIPIQQKEKVVEKTEPKIENKPEPKKEEPRSFTLRNIKFDVDAATISDKNIPELDTVAQIMQENKTLKVKVTGHTDNKGSSEYNQKLSKQRANAVAEILIQKGVPENRIQTFGKGDQDPIESNETEKGRAQNRRVEITIE